MGRETMPTKLDYVSGVAAYFSSHQFNEFIRLLRTLEQRSHIHLFVNTSIHPESFQTILKEYLKSIGLPCTRTNEVLIGTPTVGTLHGVHPKGTPHFDIKWGYKPGVTLEPMEEASGELGQNLLYWDQEYMRYFYRNYEWQPVGPKQHRELMAYFDSAHWHRGFELMATYPKVAHIHPHIQTNIHPNIVERYIQEAIVRKGWKLHRSLANVYPMFGKYYGKFMLLFEEPEVSFDFDWTYNKDVSIAPYTGPGLLQDEPGIMVIPDTLMVDFLERLEHRVLTDNEIGECLTAIAQSRNDLWR
jgi:hypothetical protein